MSHPQITDAKDIAHKHRCKAVVIVAFTGGQFSVTSYGMNRQLCDAAKNVNVQISDLLMTSVITVPDELSTPEGSFWNKPSDLKV